MASTPRSSIDARQSPQWGEYLESMGWTIRRVKDTQIFIHSIPLIRASVIKIQHPVGPLPLAKIEQIAKEMKALFLIIEPHIQGYDPEALKKNGYKKSFMQFAHTATIKIDLAVSEADLFASFSENAKRNIRKSQKNNLRLKTIRFKDDKDRIHFKQFYSLLLNLSKIKKFYCPSYEEYLQKMSAFGDTSVMLFAYDDTQDDPIAVVWLASYGDIVTYMQTGIIEHGYDVLANYFLVWEGLKLSQKQKLKVFDFETLYDPRFPKENKDWKGYSEFKRRFHGTLVEYPQPWIKVYNPVVNAFLLLVGIFH